MTLKCRSTALPNWFETGLLAVCEDQLAPYTQNIQEGIQNFQEIFLKVVLMYTANVSPVKSTGLPRVTGGTP